MRICALLLSIGSFCGCIAAAAPQEILVVAKGMTFTLPSNPDSANPVIRVRPGDRVKLVLRNDAPGLVHDFQIPAWNVKSEQIRSGHTTTVTFTVPATEGRYGYLCGPHSEMMRGFIEVASG